MSPYKRKQKQKKRKNLFRKIHRWIGFTGAIFLINLSVTGIFLNHTDDLNLHNKFITSPLLLNWYGIKAPTEFKCILINKNTSRVCQVGAAIYHNNQFLLKNKSSLVGLTKIDHLIYIATKTSIFVFTDKFELVETLETSNNLPTPIENIGTSSIENSVHLAISNKHPIWIYHQENNYWIQVKSEFTPSENSLSITTKNVEEYQNIYLNNKISYLKLIQDMHSGRMLFGAGKLITDLSGIIIILLSISGFIAWQRRTKQKT
ncbi:MAG: hypothetical protein ACPGJI_09090 [Kangiellaceae bacterium]